MENFKIAAAQNILAYQMGYWTTKYQMRWRFVWVPLILITIKYIVSDSDIYEIVELSQICSCTCW